MPDGFTQPDFLLKLESLLVFLGATTAYFMFNGSPLMYFLLFLAPDVSMIGYLYQPEIGSQLYNLIHTYVFPLAIGLIGLVTGQLLAVYLSLIWIAHIGGDRVLGYGLMYPTSFTETHLNRVKDSAGTSPPSA